MRPSRALQSVSRQTAREYCDNLVRQKDRSSYILNKYVPADGRDPYLGLRAFNLEVARVCDTFTQPALATVKLDFWRNAVRSDFKNEKDNEPVCMLLSEFPFDKRPLLTLVQSRETVFARSNPLFRDTDDMASYGEGTFSQLNYLTLQLLYSLYPRTSGFIREHSDVDAHVNSIMAHVGQAVGITSLIKATLFYAGRRGFVPLPVDLMAKHGVSPEEVISRHQQDPTGLAADDRLNQVVFETATRANDHLISANSLLKTMASELSSVPEAVRIAAMAGVPAKLFLEQLERCDFSLPKLGAAEWRLPWRSYRFWSTAQF